MTRTRSGSSEMSHDGVEWDVVARPPPRRLGSSMAPAPRAGGLATIPRGRRRPTPRRRTRTPCARWRSRRFASSTPMPRPPGRARPGSSPPAAYSSRSRPDSVSRGAGRAEALSPRCRGHGLRRGIDRGVPARRRRHLRPNLRAVSRRAAWRSRSSATSPRLRSRAQTRNCSRKPHSSAWPLRGPPT